MEWTQVQLFSLQLQAFQLPFFLLTNSMLERITEMHLSQGHSFSYTSTSFFFCYPATRTTQNVSPEALHSKTLTTYIFLSMRFPVARRNGTTDIAGILSFVYPNPEARDRTGNPRLETQKQVTEHRLWASTIRHPPPHNCFQLFIQARFINASPTFYKKILPSEAKKEIDFYDEK
jgi:hypothetical protein